MCQELERIARILSWRAARDTRKLPRASASERTRVELREPRSRWREPAEFPVHASAPEPDRSAYRLLPAVEQLLQSEVLRSASARISRPSLARLAQAELARWRARIAAGELDAARLEQCLARGELVQSLERALAGEARAGLKRALNATGVVLNTGLGRAPVHPEAARAMEEVARSYCVLEVERESGERGQRDARVGALAAELCGAEAGLAVNNNAAAVLLALAALAGGRRALVSRGELVEIGGAFRMPDVMRTAGVELVEVGTTNRTRIGDYERAVCERSAVLLKVHASNYRIVGFTEEARADELVRLARERGLACIYDLGSGLLEREDAPLPAELEAEPELRAAVAAGFDLVLYSGDKLLGAPQAGIAVGTRRAVQTLRAHPLYRALRLDKVQLAGLEATFELLRAGRGAELPARALLRRDAAELERAARELEAAVRDLPQVRARVAADGSQPGSGSAPGVLLPTSVLRIQHAQRSADELARRLRLGDPPVFARAQQNELVLDPRALLEGELPMLAAALRSACG